MEIQPTIVLVGFYHLPKEITIFEMVVDFQGLSKNVWNQTTILKHFWFSKYTPKWSQMYTGNCSSKNPSNRKTTPIEVVKRHKNLLLYSHQWYI